MTQREFLNKIISSSMETEVVEFAQKSIDALDSKNEKRRNTMNATQKANVGLMEQIKELLVQKNETMVASEIAESLGLSTQKVSALCSKLVENGEIATLEVKIKGKGKVKGFTTL